MGLLNINTANVEDLLKTGFEPVDPGTYQLEVENNLKIEPSKSSTNNIIKIELRILDDGEFKGRKIFDNLTITPDGKSDWKIAQFAIACGVCTKDTLNNIDLDNFKGTTLSAKVGVKIEKYKGEEVKKNYIKQYVFTK